MRGEEFRYVAGSISPAGNASKLSGDARWRDTHKLGMVFRLFVAVKRESQVRAVMLAALLDNSRPSPWRFQPEADDPSLAPKFMTR